MLKKLLFNSLFAYILLSFLWFIYELLTQANCLQQSEIKSLLFISLFKSIGFTLPSALLMYFNIRKKRNL